MYGLEQLLSAIWQVTAPIQLGLVLGGTLIGIIVGVLPGMTATLGIALITTMTLSVSSQYAILILISVYIGAIYGGSRTAILLNIPGTPASAATTLDGYPLARQGKAGDAMALATTGSFLGSMVGMVGLIILTPALASVALGFTSFDYFWVAMVGILLCGQLTAAGEPLKGWASGFLGVILSLVGQEPIHDYYRYTFGLQQLGGGFGLLPVLVGLFGCAEVFAIMREPRAEVVKSTMRGVWRSALSAAKYPVVWIRSGIIGTVMGVLPGVGEDTGAWVSYAVTQRFSKHPERFGKGAVEGLIASETGNNAAVPGAIVPVITLGVPGSAPAAVLLAAMIIHGLNPGPLLMVQHPEFFYELIAYIFWGTCAMFILGMLLTRPLLWILRIKREWLMGLVFLLCIVGTYAIEERLFHVWVMFGFGILGFLMREAAIPVAPMVLGFVLGPILDNSLRRALTLTNGDLLPFIQRPISLALAVVSILLIGSSLPWVQAWSRKAWRAARGRRGHG